MKRAIKTTSGILLLLIGLLLFEGCPTSLEVAVPDVEYFNRVVAVPALRDSLENNILVQGMPIFVVNQIFKHCIIDTNIAVVSVGSRQRLGEREGLFSSRYYHDPNIQVYLNLYRTEKGKLYVWHRYPDFYRFNLMSKDSVFLYDDLNCVKSRVQYLLKSTLLTLDDSVGLSRVTTAVFRSREHLDVSSYWFTVSVVSGKALKLDAPPKSLYPIVHMELGRSPISSFRWR